MEIINSREELLAKAKQYQNVIILGTENIAKTLVRFLIQPENNITPCAIAYSKKAPDAKTIKGIKISSLKKLSKKYKDNALVLVALREDTFDNSEKVLKKNGFKNFAAMSYDLFLSLSWAENVPMGFMCAGFTKCATTALNIALKKNKKIFLSKQKETNYIHWRHRYDDSPERFKTMYYPKWKKGQILGNVEPTYHRKSRQIYECFGPDLKLIFMMRNPVNATYSYFKMMMRRSQFRKQIGYYFKYKKFDVRMFDDYIRDYIVSGVDTRFKYDEHIEKYLELWPKENIKFIFFEDIIKDTEKIMNEVQEFIGVEPVAISELPSENVGSTVSKNFIGALLNGIMFKLRLKVMSIPSKKVKKWYKDTNAKLWKHTQVENNEKMTEDSRAELTEFYMDSIKNVEKITGRNLEGVWY